MAGPEKYFAIKNSLERLLKPCNLKFLTGKERSQLLREQLK